MAKFSKSEAIKFGWETTKDNFWVLVGLVLFSFLIVVSASRVPPLNFLISVFINITFIAVSLKLWAGKKVEIKDYYSKYGIFLQYLVATVLYGIIVLIGLILLIIPGIYFALKYQFYKFFIVEKGLNPLEALKESGRITEGNIWNLFWLFWIFALINLLGALLFGVGILVTAPITLLAHAFVYKKLAQH